MGGLQRGGGTSTGKPPDEHPRAACPQCEDRRPGPRLADLPPVNLGESCVYSEPPFLFSDKWDNNTNSPVHQPVLGDFPRPTGPTMNLTGQELVPGHGESRQGKQMLRKERTQRRPVCDASISTHSDTAPHSWSGRTPRRATCLLHLRVPPPISCCPHCISERMLVTSRASSTKEGSCSYKPGHLVACDLPCGHCSPGSAICCCALAWDSGQINPPVGKTTGKSGPLATLL